MSATVTYKGETLTTATNQTRVLETEGTYLEDDITITDVTGAAPSGTKNISITANGTTTEDVTSYATASITTAVPASAVDSGTKSISTNGTHDVIGYASANVAVPNSYSASDEGKVVSSGALVSQTAHADVTPTTSDQTIDTTTNNSIKVKGDADLVAGNIKKDVEIFGVTGSFEGGGGGITWDGLIENDYENEDVTYTGTTFSATIAIAKCKINKLTLTNYKNGATSWGEGGQWVELDAPELTGFGLYGLRSCTRMKKAHLPKATNLGNNNGLNGCTQLEGIVLPSLNDKIGNMSFRTNSKLEYGDFKNVTNIEASAFLDCVIFDTLIIRNTATAATLANISAFNNTCFASGKSGGTLYVPSALVSSYQSASNWSTILGYANNQIKSIESTHTDPTAPIDLTLYYADGTPIS